MNPLTDLGALAALTILLGVVAATLRRYRSRILGIGGPKELRVITRVALTSQHSIHLVQVRDETLLISTSPQDCTLLYHLKPKTQEATCTVAG